MHFKEKFFENLDRFHNIMLHVKFFLFFFETTVRLSGESGKVDVLLTKETAGVHWTELGQGLNGNNSFKFHKDRGKKQGF